MKSSVNATVNARNVRLLHLHTLADAFWSHQWPTCRFRLVITRPRASYYARTSVPGCPLAEDSSDRTSSTSTPKHDSHADWCPGATGHYRCKRRYRNVVLYLYLYLFGGQESLLIKSGQWTASHCWVTFAACAGAPSCWKRNISPSNWWQSPTNFYSNWFT